MEKNTSQNCFQCGSILIVVSSITERLEGSLFPQTTTRYRCTNTVCQEEKDRQAEKREQFRKEKAAADLLRVEKRQKEKMAKVKQFTDATT